MPMAFQLVLHYVLRCCDGFLGDPSYFLHSLTPKYIPTTYLFRDSSHFRFKKCSNRERFLQKYIKLCSTIQHLNVLAKCLSNLQQNFGWGSVVLPTVIAFVDSIRIHQHICIDKSFSSVDKTIFNNSAFIDCNKHGRNVEFRLVYLDVFYEWSGVAFGD